MPENSLDTLIKRKLEEWQMPFQSADWEEMSVRLDQAFDERVRTLLHQHAHTLSPEAWQDFLSFVQARWDASLRQKLEDKTLPLSLEDWPLMAALLENSIWESLILQKLEAQSLPPVDESLWKELDQALTPYTEEIVFRDKLDSFALPIEAGAWDAFELAREDVFDQSLKQKLESPTLESSVHTDWDRIASALDGNIFDQRIREIFSTHKIPYHPIYWLDMQDYLEARFDTTLRTKLKYYQIHPSRKDWRVLSDRLQKEGIQKVPVILMRPWLRSAVAAAILLLFLLIGTLWPTAPSQRWIALKEIIREANPFSGDSSRVQPEVSENKADLDLLVADRGEVEKVEVEPDLVIQPVVDRTIQDELSVETSMALENSSQSPQLTQVTSKTTEGDAVAHEETHSNPTDAFKAYREIQSINRNFVVALNDQVKSDDRESSFFQKLGPRIPELSFGVHGGYLRSKVELNGPSANPGFTAGLRLKLDLNDKWSVVSGLQYGKKKFYYEYRRSIPNFNNRTLTEGTESNEVATDGEMTVLDLPLLLRFTIPSLNPLRLYVQGGTVSTISLNESIAIKNSHSPLNSGTSGLVTTTGLESVIIDRKLQTYPGNIYFSVGIDFPISDHLNMEIEPFFLQNLQRLKEYEGLDISKRLYTTGISLSLMFNYQE